MNKNSWEWKESDLLALIEHKVQENLEMDYKQCDALQITESRKNEISKDVSAFANSAGGVIVYGMKENGHVPTALDIGFDPNQISKEWLEQVINSRIQRRLVGVRVNQVDLATTAPGKVAYVVYVPQSRDAPHQASDKRFYKRFNFESVPMEEYEIRDVANRPVSPDLDIELEFRPGGSTTKLGLQQNGFYPPVFLAAVLRNNSQIPAEHAVVDICIDTRIRVLKSGHDARVSSDPVPVPIGDEKAFLQKLTVIWGTNRDIPIFHGITADLPTEPLEIQIPHGPKWLALGYTIGAPRMTVKNQFNLLTVSNDGVASIHVPGRNANLPTEPKS
jgi:hypothetical protein